jgi:hypothetical protein
VEPSAEWERYALVVLPDELAVDEALASRLGRFVRHGGAVVACHKAGVLAGSEKSWLEPYGMTYDGISPFQPAYLIPKEKFTGDIPEYEYALYAGASQWKVSAPASVVAHLGEPLFQRSPAHYTSHKQSPFHHATGYAAMARSRSVAVFGFPLGASYFAEGYWVYRHALRHMLRSIYSSPLVETNAPATTEITVTHQARRLGRNERYLVHIVNFSPLRGTPKHPVFHEEPVPLADIAVSLNLPLPVREARAVISGATLPTRRSSSGGVQVVVPRIPIHEIVCFEVG